MKYYKITSDHSIGVIGGSTFQVLPPSNRYNSDNVDDSLNIIGSFFKGWTKDVKPNIPRLEIAKNAILTNSLSTSSFSSKYYGLVLDVELYNFFSGFKIESHITYDLELFQTRGNINVDINNYKYLVICSEGLEHIDFARSSIVKWYHFEKGNNEELVFNDKSEIEIYYRNHIVTSSRICTLGARTLTLKKGFNLDLFRFDFISPGCFVSERLKVAIENSHYTGLKFKLANYMKIT